MSATLLNTKFKGLATLKNKHALPAGTASVCKNVENLRDDLITTRRGFDRYGSEVNASADRYAENLFLFQDKYLVQDQTGVLYYENLGAWTALTNPLVKPTGATASYSAKSNKNIYYTSSTGIKKQTAFNSELTDAGVIEALDAVLFDITLGPPGTAMPTDSMMAVRIVYGTTDVNGNLILGAPSSRLVFANTTGVTKNPEIRVSLPTPYLTTAHFIQVYRSVCSSSSTTEPSDELFLCFEKQFTSGDLSSVTMNILLEIPDSVLQTRLYTNPSEQGILQANQRPPLSKDMALYNGQMFYANTQLPQAKTFTLIAIGGIDGMVVDDTIQIGSLVLTAKASATVASGFFRLQTSGTPAENIEASARSIVSVINQTTLNTLYYAYYQSGSDDLPGQILIRARSSTTAAFAIISNRPGAFAPQLPTSGSSYLSTAEVTPNRVYYSKIQQPESVPALNFLEIGDQSDVLRLIPLRESLFVFKEDGIYRISGAGNSFSVDIIDQTAILRANDTLVPFANSIIGLFNQGVCMIAETGVQILSREIEDLILSFSASPVITQKVHAVAHETDRQYYLFYEDQTETNGGFVNRALVWNNATQTWCGPWHVNVECALTNPVDDTMLVGWKVPFATRHYVRYQKRFDSETTYTDRVVAVTPYANPSSFVVLVAFAGTPEWTAGWAFGTDGHLIVSSASLGSGNYMLTLSKPISITVFGPSINLYQPIPFEFKANLNSGGAPGVIKNFREGVLFVDDTKIDNVMITVASDVSSQDEEISVVSLNSTNPWGTPGWGGFPWGGGSQSQVAIRFLLPRDKQRCAWLEMGITHSQPFCALNMGGMGLQVEEESERRY